MRNDGRRSIWREPRAAGAPDRTWLDWVLLSGFEAAAVFEAVARPDIAWRPLAIVIGLGFPLLLMWRRSHPLVCAVIAFGVAMMLSTIQLVTGAGDIGLYSMILIVLLLYALVRWGSGREIVLGLGFITVAVALGMVASFTVWADVIGGAVFLLCFVALATAFRVRADVWNRQLAELRNEERVGLARELHDTVAHHVSAIAVQAQAGRVVAAARPEASVEVLAAIEAEASRALTEMRAMVRVLREGTEADYAPQPGVADLPALARRDAAPVVEVRLDGDLTELPRTLDAAVYRLAQESLTNALRHAHDATRVAIDVRRDNGRVLLRVADDGRASGALPAAPGFGLVGMAERAQLLGGTLHAGPAPGGGWAVEAALPVEVTA
ncbi:MAG: sensor histidine kinase [Nocardioidaceae bacterium]